MNKECMMKNILVWDIPTRLFHWLFALSFTVAFITAEADGWAVVHVFTGLLMLMLIAYRVIWGIIGSRYARFSSFLFSPATAVKYLFDSMRGKAERHVGHNPAGSWAIYLLLLLGTGISVTGLALLSSGEQFEDIHEALSYGALAVVAVHIAGVIAASFLHRENLPRAMVTGCKTGEDTQSIPSARPIAALAMLVLLVTFSMAYWKGWDAQTQTVTLPFLSQPLALGEHGEGGDSGKLAREDNDD